MKTAAASNNKQTSKPSASMAPLNNTANNAVGFLMIYMTAIFLNVEQTKDQDLSSQRFASAFLTLFISIFVLRRGKLELGPIYLLLALIAPELRQPAMIGTLFVLYFFLFQ